MGVGDLAARGPHAAGRAAPIAPHVPAPAEDEQLGVVVAVDLDRRDVVGDAGDLRRPAACTMCSWFSGS